MGGAGYVSEIFRSIQGEGPYIGVLQVFLRTSGCSQSCVYCDTTFARKRTARCILRGPEGVSEVSNPVQTDTLLEHIGVLIESSNGVHSLSVTGGEPLEQPKFLTGFLERFRQFGMPVYLETNGLHEEAARDVVDLVDMVSLDIKLPSLCGGGDLLPAYERVLPVLGKKEMICKVVVAAGFDYGEFMDAVRLVSRFSAGLQFVIQPASPSESCGTVEGEELLKCYMDAAGILGNVRLIPQCHRILGLP